LDVVLQIFPSDTNFLLVRFKDSEAIYQALISKSVIVRNRNNLVSGCLRISIGTKLEQEKFITVLKRITNEEGIIY
jgi:histidinol-phosphate aminotransferase